MKLPSRNACLFTLVVINLVMCVFAYRRTKQNKVVLSREVNSQIEQIVQDRLLTWSTQADRVLTNLVRRSSVASSEDVPSDGREGFSVSGSVSYHVYGVGQQFYIYDGAFSYRVGDYIPEGFISFICPAFLVADGRKYRIVRPGSAEVSSNEL